MHLLTNLFSFSLLDHRANLLKSKVLEARRKGCRGRVGYPSPQLRILANRWNPKRNEASYVSDTTKELLWGSLLPHFNLPVNFTEGQMEKLKEWTLKKMAVQFQTWKKKLWDKYADEDPVFTGRLEKIKDH